MPNVSWAGVVDERLAAELQRQIQHLRLELLEAERLAQWDGQTGHYARESLTPRRPMPAAVDRTRVLKRRGATG